MSILQVIKNIFFLPPDPGFDIDNILQPGEVAVVECPRCKEPNLMSYRVLTDNLLEGEVIVTLTCGMCGKNIRKYLEDQDFMENVEIVREDEVEFVCKYTCTTHED